MTMVSVMKPVMEPVMEPVTWPTMSRMGAVAVAWVRSGTRVVVKQNPPTSPAGT
ncbi:hypothetical protein [Corynebacterium xerosis]|uniref:hypothetical protein n=1 Tax=Corynebacterium xerosis TaxID=1725 RepID=UPI00387993C3